jgi:Domain of unknown function (DUF4439)
VTADTPLGALQEALAGEHAAVYVYGVLGGRLSASTHPTLAAQLSAAYSTHRSRRDQLTAMVRAGGGQPAAADLSYVMPGPSRTPEQITDGARVVERRCAAVYAATAGGTSGADRRWAVSALTDAAVRELSFGGRPSPWPGVTDL